MIVRRPFGLCAADRRLRPPQFAHVPVIEPWHVPCELIGAGDFRAQFDTQRRLAIIFRQVALCASGNAAPKMDAEAGLK